MSSQPPKSMDGDWLPLEPASPAIDEQAKMTLAQLSWVAILFSVIFVLLPAIFTGWGTPPWLWPDWGKIAGLIGVCLWGWMCISCGINLAKRRVSSGRLSGGLGPYAVSMMRG